MTAADPTKSAEPGTSTDTTDRFDSGFGSVSRMKGVVFQYIALGASLVGIVTLAVLLGHVSADAFGIDAADPAWFLTFGLTLVVPSTGFLWYVSRTESMSDVLTGTIVRLGGGTEFAIAVLVLFMVTDSQLWFLLYTLGLAPTAALFVYDRTTDDSRISLSVQMVVLAVGLVAGFLLKIPLDTYPIDVLIYLWTIGVPVAAYYGYRWRSRAGTVTGALVGIGVLAATAAAGFGVTAVSEFGPGIGIVLALTPGVLTASYVGKSILDRPVGRRALLFPFVVLAGVLVGHVIVTTLGIAGPEPWLDWQFLTSAASRFPEKAGFYPAIIGSVLIIVLVAAFSFVFGVGTAVYLEEYAPESGVGGALRNLVQVNISNLAGVPSVVYGLLGLALFVNLLGLGFGIVIVAAMTLSLLILPIVVIAAQEAIRSVPDSLRHASYAMGATRWQTVRSVVLPESIPGILTGTILALGRAIGETAPLILVGVASTTFSAPTGLFDTTAAMPTQIYAWAFRPSEAFREGVVAAGVVTLMVVLLSINSVAIYVRNNYERGS